MDANIELAATLQRMEMAKPRAATFIDKCRPVQKGEIFLIMAGKKVKIELPEDLR